MQRTKKFNQHYISYSVQIINQFRALKATVSALKATLRQPMKIKAPSQINFENKPSVIAPTAVSKLQLDNSFRNSLYSLFRNEAPYDDIITELESGKTQVVENDEVYKRMNGVLVVHSHHQDAELDFWRIVVPSDASTKERIMQELHSTPYSAHFRGL